MLFFLFILLFGLIRDYYLCKFIEFLPLKRIETPRYTADAVNFVKIIVNLKNSIWKEQMTENQKVSITFLT